MCARAELLTSFGLRSLGPGEPGYHGRYAGKPQERDAAYHQGTVWGWLLGPFALAHLRVYQDPDIAASFLERCSTTSKPLARHGERNFRWRSAVCTAGLRCTGMDVGETLRAWRVIAAAQAKSGSLAANPLAVSLPHEPFLWLLRPGTSSPVQADRNKNFRFSHLNFRFAYLGEGCKLKSNIVIVFLQLTASRFSATKRETFPAVF